MPERVFSTEQWVPAPLPKVFLFFGDPRNLPRITPPDADAHLVSAQLIASPSGAVESSEGLAGNGSEIVVSFRLFPFFPFRGEWTARFVEFVWNQHFRDIQVKGPFKQFDHRHEFEAAERDGRPGTIVRDIVRYEVGYGPFGAAADALFVRRRLRAMFEYRHRALERILAETQASR